MRPFDPGRCEGTCPSCGQGVGSPPGQPTTGHQKPHPSRETCPGGTTQQ